MSEQWPVKTLGEVVETLRNGVNCKQNKSGIGAPISRIETIAQAEINYEKVGFSEISDEKKEKYGLKKNDILFSHINSPIHVGKTAIVKSNRELIHGVNLLLIRPNDEILPHFMNYYLIFLFKSKYWLRVCKKSVNQASVNQKDIKKVPIVVPSLEEQKRIVKIIDEALEKISNSLNHNEINLKSARSILLRGIDQEFLNNDTWIEQKFGDVCKFVRGPFGGSLKKAFFVDKGYAVYEQSHAIYDQFETVRYFIDDAKFSEMQRFELKSGDLIMSCSGTIGKIAIVPDGIKPGIINQALLKLTPNELILPEFLKYWMKSMDFQEAIKLHSGGAAIQNIASVKILKQITIHLPSIEEQKEIIGKLNLLTHSSQDLVDLFSEKKEATTELKQSILQEAFNGNLTKEITV